MKILYFFLIVGLTVFTMGCIGNDTDKFVGKWRLVNDGATGARENVQISENENGFVVKYDSEHTFIFQYDGDRDVLTGFIFGLRYDIAYKEDDSGHLIIAPKIIKDINSAAEDANSGEYIDPDLFKKVDKLMEYERTAE